jgi:UDP-2,4-diacetamido-2,4,6-trideoxy-beta-L-altropyranose hydrolase
VNAPRVVLRADATGAIGWGHLKRCTALALALREQGADVAFCGHAEGTAAPAQLAALGLCWTALPSPLHAGAKGDAEATLAALPWSPDLVVVDHYGLGAAWHAAVREATRARIVVIDDLADRALAPDLLIDHNPAEDHRAKYRAVMPAAVPLCAGPRYALLDPVYAQRAREMGPSKPSALTRIGIFMGGTDPADHSTWALRVLRETVGWTGAVQIASTSANPHLAALRSLAMALDAELLCDRPHLADFHTGCGLQIGAGGGALWERCCLGVPTLALVCAANQRLSVPLLDRAGVVVGLDAVERSASQAAALAAALRQLIESPTRRLELHQRARALVDGRGAERAAAAILALPARSPGRQSAAAIH